MSYAIIRIAAALAVVVFAGAAGYAFMVGEKLDAIWLYLLAWSIRTELYLAYKNARRQ